VKIFSENKGLGFARQLVVDNASGKYIVWVDSDILLSRTYLKEQVNFMEQNSNVAIAVGCYGLMPNENWVSVLESIGYVVESLKHVGKETSNLIGTKGSIFRLDAIKSVGSFDTALEGAQEDLDLAYKLKLAGWKFFITNAMLYEKQRLSWSAIWKRHFWYGYGLHSFQHKHKERNMFIVKSNDRIIISSLAYRLTNRKIVFLLPINFFFRKIALLFGFISAHLNGYGHNH
jgi:glycosyltransferase involved in cell wall biosynthesis